MNHVRVNITDLSGTVLDTFMVEAPLPASTLESVVGKEIPVEDYETVGSNLSEMFLVNRVKNAMGIGFYLKKRRVEQPGKS